MQSSTDRRVFVIPTKPKINNHLRRSNSAACQIDDTKRSSDFMDVCFSNRNSHFVHKLVAKDYPLAAKIVWLIIIILCSVLTLIQIGNTIRIYLSEPVAVTVQIVRNDSMWLPRVTICGKAKFAENKTRIWAAQLAETKGHVFPKNMKFEDALNYLIDEYGVEQVWNNTCYNIPEMMQKCNIFHKAACSDYGHWTPVFTLFGLCYSYSLDTKILSAGPYQALYITLKPDNEIDIDRKGWKILVHHWNVKPDLRIQTEGFTLDPNTRVDVVMDYHQFASLSTTKKPCNSSSNYSITTCETSCVYELLIKQFGCRLPYMNYLAVPVCGDSKTYNAIYEQQEKILEDGINSLSHICNCPRPCREHVYKMKLDLRLWYGDQHTTVKVYFDDLNYERVEEHVAYGIVQLLSDIGGNLGLFLGVCVVSIFEVGEIIMCKLIRLFKLLMFRNQ